MTTLGTLGQSYLEVITSLDVNVKNNKNDAKDGIIFR